jgi:hypothetical protein
MSQLRNTSPAPSRRRLASAVTSFAVALLAGSALAACSSTNPVEPTPAAQTVAPTGPNHTGFQVGWGFGGDGNGAELQGGATAGMKAPVTPVDSVKVDVKGVRATARLQ